VINLNFTLFVQLANFLILLFVLNELLYKPILAKIREREETIRADREKVESLWKRVRDQEERHKEELAAARQAAAEEKASLLAQAKKVESETLDKARAEAAKIVDDTKASVEAEAVRVREAMKAEMAPLANSIAQKILGRQVA
jgi:F-type H+-transporting ATPase subunit b